MHFGIFGLPFWMPKNPGVNALGVGGAGVAHCGYKNVAVFGTEYGWLASLNSPD